MATVRIGPKPPHKWQTWTDWAARISFATALFTFWELSARNASRALAAPPSEILQAFWQLTFVDRIILEQALITGKAFAMGFAASVVIGLGIGLLMGRSRLAEYLLEPYVTLMYALPSIALIPLLVIWFGITDNLRFILVILSAVFPIIYNTSTGVKNVDPDLIEVAKTFCAGERKIATSVILPAAFPLIFAGLRIGLSHALVGIIGAEIIAVITGLGGLVIVYADRFQMANMFVPIIVIMMLAVTITAGMNRIQKRVSRWQIQID
jgi:ABC-type nitrate/sulfonate/bicarbonate transport system permease component